MKCKTLCLALTAALSCISLQVYAASATISYGVDSTEWNADTKQLVFSGPLNAITSGGWTFNNITIDTPAGSGIVTQGDNPVLNEMNGSNREAAQLLTVNNALGIISTGSFAFRAVGSSSGTFAAQGIKATEISEILINPTAPTTAARSALSNAAFLSSGAYARQTIGADTKLTWSETNGANLSDPTVKAHIGKISTSMSGVGIGMSVYNFSGQRIYADIDSIGSQENPMNAGIVADFRFTANRLTTGTQYVGNIGEIWATEVGISTLTGGGKVSQTVESVGSIHIDGTKLVYSAPMLAAIAGETNSLVPVTKANLENATNLFGQEITVTGSLTVDGPISAPENTGLQYSFVSHRISEAASLFRAGVVNRGGNQLINFRPEDNGFVNISVGKNNANDLNNYAVLIYPIYSGTIAKNNDNRTYASAPTKTKLTGSFNVESGNVAVFGPQKRSTFGDNMLRSGNVTLELQPGSANNGKLVLGEQSSLWVTDRSFDYVNNSIIRAQYYSTLEEGDPTPVYQLTAGSGNSAESAYQIQMTGADSFIYVDGTFSGNATISMGSQWNDSDRSVSVNGNHIVIKNIEKQSDTENSHLNLNVDLTSSLPADKRDAFLDSGNVNIQVLMNQAVKNLLVADGKENLSEGGLIITGDRVDVSKISEGGQNLALKDPTKASSDARKVAGYVTVTTPEGLITPRKTFVSEYYLENSDATGKVVSDVLTELNDKVNNTAAALHGTTLTATASDDSMSLAEDEESAKYASGSGSIYSPTAIPDKATATEAAKPDTPNNPDNPDNGNGDGDNSDNNQGGNSGSNSGSEGGSNGSQGGSVNLPTTVEGKTSTMASLESVGMSNYFVWREDLETLSQRLGEVRMTPELEGLWVRVLGGKNKYNRSSDYFRNKFYGIQLGVDRNIGGDFGWTIGAAFSYIDGNAKLANGGKDDNYFGSFSLYATKQFENAGYLDVIAKFSRMHNDFTAVSNDRVYFSKGKYSTNAYQIGVEYGKKFVFGQNWFADPQVQLTYGHINKANYKTDTGVDTKVKGINSLTGRVGVAGGYQSDKVYAFVRVDALRDFTAKYKADYQVGNVRNHSTESLKDTWGEVSAGTTVNLGKDLKGYAQVKRSFAAKVKQEYRADIGLRLVF